ncbi:MAG: hypothetical protein VKO26_01805 [Cyanobacteriota bacterium]|nr:hypothetical protein [Cyanobacteriota bacterium]
MLDASTLGQPALPPRAGRMRARALLAGALLAGPLGLAQGSKADPLVAGEVCSADASRATSVWRCAPSPTNTVFWVPPCTSGDLALDVSSGTRSLIVYSTDQGRRLTVNGTTGNDILVGSPLTSETLRGGNGRNTYIVGGANTYTAAAGDAIILTATSKELDSVRLNSPLPDYIHINAPAQSNPGSLITAASPAVPVPLRGSSDLAGVSVCPSAFLFPPARRGAPTARLAMGASEVPCSPCVASASARETTAEDFPGVTTIEGFDLHPQRGDRILLPAELYRFQGKSLEGRPVIPTLIVQDVRFRPGGVLVTEEELRRVLREASGLEQIRSAQAPLVYFPQNGLLVFSQNAEALGSRRNPGRVIARLLAGDGRPLKLPQPAREALFPARFVAFTPTPPRTTAGPLAPQPR